MNRFQEKTYPCNGIDAKKLSDFEKEVLFSFNNTHKDYCKEKTIHGLFMEQAGKSPECTALVFKDKKLTYRELDEKSNQLAEIILGKSTPDNSIVGIMAMRSIDMIVGILAVLKSGKTYLPIDPSYPQDRINYMLEDSKTGLLLTQRVLAEKIRHKCKQIYMDDAGIYAGAVSLSEQPAVKSDNPAYVMYTSGSSGKPKGVIIEHRSVHNFIQGVSDVIDFSGQKAMLSLASISFDMSVLETIVPLCTGLTVVIADEDQQKNPGLLGEAILNNKVRMLSMTPSRMQTLLTLNKCRDFLKPVTEIMLGGEQFPPVLLEKLNKTTGAKIYNMYGPTETTVYSAIQDLTGRTGVDIGTPIANTGILIVDENGRLQPPGTEGELCICGDGLARGYLNKPELTDEKFVPNPYSPEEKMYRTGDLAKWLPDGRIECLGRIDNQVKIRGYRIELGEIEAQLLKNNQVTDAAVVAKTGKDGNKYLCAYVVSEGEPDISGIKSGLSKELPDYMIPTHIVKLSELPLTPNSKVDLKSLTELDIEGDVQNKAKTRVESTIFKDKTNLEKLKKIIEHSASLPMPVDMVSFDEPLENLGIDSVSYITILVNIESEFGFEFGNKYLALNTFPNLQALASYIESKILCVS